VRRVWSLINFKACFVGFAWFLEFSVAKVKQSIYIG